MSGTEVRAGAAAGKLRDGNVSVPDGVGTSEESRLLRAPANGHPPDGLSGSRVTREVERHGVTPPVLRDRRGGAVVNGLELGERPEAKPGAAGFSADRERELDQWRPKA